MVINLEEIVDLYKNFADSAGIVKTLQQDPTNPQARSSFIPIFIENQEIPEERGEYLNREYTQNPGLLRTHAEALTGEYHGKFSEKMKDGYKELVANLNAEQLKILAHSLPDTKNKLYMRLSGGSSNELNSDELRKAYASLSPKSKLWVHFCMNASEDLVKSFANQYTGEEQKRFEKEQLCVETTEKNGTKSYKLDDKRTRDYVISIMDGLKDQEKEQSYEMLIGTYLKAKEKKKK